MLSDPRARATGVFLVAAVVLSGCGAQHTGHGAPPYQSGTSQTPRLRTSYPVLHLTFRLPGLASDQVVPVRDYIGFQVAYERSVRRHKVLPALQRATTPALRALIATQVKGGTVGSRATPTTIKVQDVAVDLSRASLRLCVVTRAASKPYSALLTAGATGGLRVASLGPDRKRHAC